MRRREFILGGAMVANLNTAKALSIIIPESIFMVVVRFWQREERGRAAPQGR